jgi:magnesium transporter
MTDDQGHGTGASATGSHIRGFYRSGDGVVTSFESEHEPLIRSALADDGGVLWIDLVTTDHVRARILRDIFGFHPLTIDDTVSPRVDPAKIDAFDSYLFIVVQAFEHYRRGEELNPIEVEFYLGPNYVISCHREVVPSIEDFRTRCQYNPRELHHAADWLLHGLLDAIVDEYLPIVDELDDDIDRLEEATLTNGNTGLLKEILLTKKNALKLRRATVPQREIVARLSRNDFPELIRPEASIYFRDVYDHLVRVDYLIEGVRDQADGALQTYLSAISNRLNEVMKVLTAAATLFLPLTVITGVYGMNFQHNVFPAFNSTWGFAAVITLMLVNSIMMLAYFRIRRWI